MKFPEKLHKISENIQPQDIAVVGGNTIAGISVYLDAINGFLALLLTGATLIYTIIRIFKILEKTEKEE